MMNGAIYQDSRPLNRSESDEAEKRFKKALSSEFEEN